VISHYSLRISFFAIKLDSAEIKYIMQKVTCLICLVLMSFLSISEAANRPTMPSFFKQSYLYQPSPIFYSATRPKVDRSKEDKTSVEEDMKAVDKGHSRAPISNPEDRVIEFIVSDIGR